MHYSQGGDGTESLWTQQAKPDAEERLCLNNTPASQQCLHNAHKDIWQMNICAISEQMNDWKNKHTN